MGCGGVQAGPRVQAGPHYPGMPRAPALTSRGLCGISSFPPLKTFAGAAQFGEIPPQLLADGVFGGGDPSAGGSFAMLPPVSAKDGFGTAPLCRSLAGRCPLFHLAVPQFPSPPPLRAVAGCGGVPLETGICKHRSESVLGPAHAAASCVSAEGAREIAKHLLSGTESFFIIIIFPPALLARASIVAIHRRRPSLWWPDSDGDKMPLSYKSRKKKKYT